MCLIAGTTQKGQEIPALLSKLALVLSLRTFTSLICGQALDGFLLIANLHGRAQFAEAGAFPGQVGLHCLRKGAEEADEQRSSVVSVMPPSSCFGFPG